MFFGHSLSMANGFGPFHHLRNATPERGQVAGSQRMASAWNQLDSPKAASHG